MNLFDLADLRTPWCLHTAATLHIAEHINAGHTQIEDLANLTHSHEFTLHCLLDHLVSKGIFEQPEPGRFTLNELAQGLLDPALLIGLNLNGIGGRMAHAWSTLLPYVQTGTPAYKQIFGRTFWEDLDANPVIAASFDDLIGSTGHGAPDPDFPLTIGWKNVHSVVDVGGGAGSMLAEILQAHPHIHGILVDLPRTIARAPQLDRLTSIGQSFFDPLPAGADLYLLRGVLNNWPDPEAKIILTRCAEAARPNGRVVVLKGVRDVSAPQPISIDMVLCGGKSRTETEFKDLAEASGLRVVSVHRQNDRLFSVECQP